MRITLPNGGIIYDITTVTIDTRGIITCMAESTEIKDDDYLANRQSEKHYDGAKRNVIRAKQTEDSVRISK